MTPNAGKPAAPPSRRLSSGWIVLGGSVLASFVWWLLSPPPKGPAPVPTPPSVATPSEPVPAAAVPETPSAPAAVTPLPPKESPAVRAESAPVASPVHKPLLRVTGDVAGADVFVDRAFVGKTPFETRDVKPGSHQVTVSAEGYDGIARHVQVSPDAPTDVTFSLKAVVLGTTVQVVHKHRLGSCQGLLSADLGGVRYAPIKGDDGFTAPLPNLETFVVDDQDKRLRLKIKGGKSFTFTTTAAHANSLFAFHRAVDKAR